MKKRIRENTKRILTLILVFTMLLTSVPYMAFPVFAEGDAAESGKPSDIAITMDGEAVSAIIVPDNGKVTLTASAKNADGVKYQWQILSGTDASRWINIHGATRKTLDVSYSLVGSMLDASGRANIRCVLKDKSDQYPSESIEVRISQSVNDGKDSSGQYLLPKPAPSVSEYSVAALSDEEHITYSIVINYLFDNNAIAFEPYGASVAKGSDFSAVITSPEVVGYAPFRRSGEDYIEAKTVELSYTNINSDITINVIYEPALVDFAVHHHLQHLDDDDYSVNYDLITYGKALTGSIVAENLALTEKELPGFKALEYERLTVAADGSTVVEIRYNRNYYFVDFDINGGFGTEPMYMRYGSTVGANDPTRHGYVFDGWELVYYGGQAPTTEQASQYDINGSTIVIPNANLTYRARWITQETEYTMVFWKENADDNGYSYWGYLDGIAAMSGSYVNGADRISEVAGVTDVDYFTYNSAMTDHNVMVEGDGSTVVNVYYTRNRYTITFKAEGKCSVPVGHTHNDDCYTAICGKAHVHSAECDPTLTCTVPEHISHSDECLTCGKVEHTHSDACCSAVIHTHTKSCWSSVGNASTPANAPSNPQNGQIYRRSYYYYIYIAGTWYRYNGWGASSGDIVDPRCGETEHIHGDDCCSVEQHAHTDSCYKDQLHTHGEDCYSYSCGSDPHVHIDTCLLLTCPIPVGHTHSNTCNNSGSVNTVKIVQRKYQQSLEDIWPVLDDNGVLYDDGQRWDPSGTDYYTEVLVYIANMSPGNMTLTLDESTNEPYTMNYYLEVLPGEAYTHEYGGKQYILKMTVKARYSYVTRQEDFFDIKGYVQLTSNPGFNSSNQINSSKNIDFYYARITEHMLQFNNNGIVLNDKNVSGIMYGHSLKEYEFTPDYPSNLEPNAYTFGGWYTSSGCFDGTEVNWDTITMLEGDMMLYAKWEPILHTVKVFKDATLTEQIGETQYVKHKELANAPTEAVENGNYIFQGWFYMDTVDGVQQRKAFAFNSIPVFEDMNIYAEWSSHVSVDYTINYVLQSTGEPIADPTVGSAIAGHNETFYAKAGSELYDGYGEGYYPLVNSHTITMSVDGTHTFTFEYIYVESMPYIVRYLDADTGAEVLPQKKVDNNNLSVVTETFIRVDKMMPDAYQKRLILSASGDDTDGDGILDSNVITFNYKADEVHAYYKVVHYIENISKDTYREYRSVETVGNIGESYTIDALELTGFEFNGALTKIDGVLTPVNSSQVTHELGTGGMLVEMYYDRQEVSYTVMYVDNRTGTSIIAPQNGTGFFGEQIVSYAPDLTNKGYNLVSESAKTMTLSANVTHNVIEFVYQEAVVAIKYQTVGVDGCGTLSQYSENVTAISGVANGSVPTPSAGYHFVGWFLDTAGTMPVNSSWVDPVTNKFTPQKASDAVWVDNQTYYARFDPDNTDFTISTLGTQSADSDQAFIFRIVGVSGTETENIDIIVSIIGNGSVTVAKLPVGKYTVSELTDWSWRYDTALPSREVTLSVNISSNTVSFNNSRSNDKWLDGNSISTNVFD